MPENVNEVFVDKQWNYLCSRVVLTFSGAFLICALVATYDTYLDAMQKQTHVPGVAIFAIDRFALFAFWLPFDLLLAIVCVVSAMICHKSGRYMP